MTLTFIFLAFSYRLKCSDLFFWRNKTNNFRAELSVVFKVRIQKSGPTDFEALKRTKVSSGHLETVPENERILTSSSSLSLPDQMFHIRVAWKIRQSKLEGIKQRQPKLWRFKHNTKTIVFRLKPNLNCFSVKRACPKMWNIWSGNVGSNNTIVGIWGSRNVKSSVGMLWLHLLFLRTRRFSHFSSYNPD